LSSKGTTLAIVLLVVGLAVGAGVGYYAMPPKIETTTQTVTVTEYKRPLEGKKIQIGWIASSADGLQTDTPLKQQIITPDMNAMAKRLGYGVTWEYLIDNADGQAAVHLEKVQAFKSMGVTVFEGGGWSSQAQAAVGYCDTNDMLMWSSSSTSPLLMIPDDNLYRMCPTDLVQAPAIAQMLWSFGIKAIVVIQRGDSWADGIYNILNVEYPKLGGVILERVRYAAEVTEYSSYLQTADNILAAAKDQYGMDRMAIEIIAFEEAQVILTQAEDYTTLYNVKWFGSDGTAVLAPIKTGSPTQGVHVGCYSTMAAPSASAKYENVSVRYTALTDLPLAYYRPCSYDIATVVFTSMMEKQSTAAKDIIPLQSSICYDTWGVSGWCRLNADGDRYAANYDIWGCFGSPMDWVKCGLYDGVTGQVTWYPTVLGYTPPGP
jgi:branched-chain amino acid transport system substrate-binding protein